MSFLTVSVVLLTGCSGDDQAPGIPGPPAQLIFVSEPADADPDGTITPPVVVAIQDASGNTVTSATAPVTVSLAANPGGASLAGTTTVTPVAGLATFDDLAINHSGDSYLLSATSGSLIAATSVAFDVVFPFRQVSAGGYHTCGVTADDKAYCWGSNFGGALGDNTLDNRNVAVPVAGGLSFASVSAGFYTCGITTAGSTYCWGNGVVTASLIPVLVPGGQTFVSVSTGNIHSCGLTAAGAAYCWGDNSWGELGDSTDSSSSTPVLVRGGISFTAISAGSSYTCGLAVGGDAYCWGANTVGQLGDSTTEARRTPVRVGGGQSYNTISAGQTHTCGIASSGGTYCWGRNYFGELGDGTIDDSDEPVLVSGNLSFTDIESGGYHTCGLTTNGLAYCWGSNSSGMLGDGTLVNDRHLPTLVQGGLLLASLETGLIHNCATAASGRAYCWGDNGDGQLGDRTDSDKYVPTPVSAP